MSGRGDLRRPEPTAATGPASPGMLADWLTYRAAASPDRTALEAAGERWTYASLDRAATAMAHRLAADGTRSGDRVASLLGNGPLPVILVHALLRLGATLVPLNSRLRDAELAWQLADVAPRLLVTDERNAALAASALEALRASHAPPVALVRLDQPAADSPATGAVDPPSAGATALRRWHQASDVLAIIYTSGTTGQPKGAELTVGNFWWSAVGSALNLGAHPDDRWLAVLPLFHIGGLSIALRSAIHGTTIIVHDGFDAAAANRAIDEDRVTIVSVVTVMLQRMLDARADRPYPPSLRCVLLGGGPAPAALLERCAASGIPVVQTYGLTEACSQVATLSLADAQRKIGSAGRPLYPNEVRIAAVRDAPAGTPGEILVRGPIVMAGYTGRPAETARAIDGGWLRTGDIGSLDDEGFLYVHDRRDDLIITGGENVYPAEVEAALLAHPWVAEAAVIGAPDERWGQRVVGIVRLADGVTASPAGVTDQLRSHCRGLLGGYKVPAEIRVAAGPLPRTSSGKLRRAALRDDR